MRFPHLLALTLLACLAALPSFAACPLDDPADCVYVDDDCVNVPGTGTQLDPFCTIVDAYASVVATTTPLDPATILVLPGTYSECPDLALTFDGEADFNDDRPVHLVADAWLEAGSPTPDLADSTAFELVAQSTTISGLGVCDSELVGTGVEPTLAIAGSGASVRGFFVTSGGLSGIEAIGPVSVESNLVAGNQGDAGGGIAVITAVCAYGDVTSTIANNVIRDNVADDDAFGDPKDALFDGFGDGGGIFIEAVGEIELLPACLGGQAVVEVRENLVFNNTATNLVLSDENNDTFAAGGGIDVETLADQGDFEAELSQARVVIENNVIRQNTTIPGADGLSFGAGVFVNMGDSPGLQAVEIRDNEIGPNNVASSSGDFGIAFGGGISASVTAFSVGQRELVIDGNTITQNQADIGAGTDLLALATSMVEGSSMSVKFNRNVVTENVSVFEAGGLNVEVNTVRTADKDDKEAFFPDTVVPDAFFADLTEFVVSNNVVRGNTSSGSAGGGAVLRPSSDSDEFFGPPNFFCFPSEFRPSTAIIDLEQNLFENNTATVLTTFGATTGCSDAACEAFVCAADSFCCETEWDQFCADAATFDFPENCDCDDSNCCMPSGQQVIGPGVLALPSATGEAVSVVTIDDSTVVDNRMLDEGFVGGVEIAATTFDDCFAPALGFKSGMALVDVSNSIIAFNDADGIGGPPLSPFVDLTVDVRRSSVFGNGDDIPGNDPDLEYETTLFPLGAPAGNILTDPLLDPTSFVPGLCSPVYSVGSCQNDPLQICFGDADCATATPESGSPSCVREGAGFFGSPDVSGDGAVDGVDLLRFSSAFGTTDGTDLRYTSEADLDGNGKVEGDDLDVIAPLFGQECVDE